MSNETDTLDAPVFVLEGPLGAAHCYRTDVGFLLYFEDYVAERAPEKIGEYSLTTKDAVAIAFQDSKQFVGLDGWDKNWREFFEETQNGEAV